MYREEKGRDTGRMEGERERKSEREWTRKIET